MALALFLHRSILSFACGQSTEQKDDMIPRHRIFLLLLPALLPLEDFASDAPNPVARSRARMHEPQNGRKSAKHGTPTSGCFSGVAMGVDRTDRPTLFRIVCRLPTTLHDKLMPALACMPQSATAFQNQLLLLEKVSRSNEGRRMLERHFRRHRNPSSSAKARLM